MPTNVNSLMSLAAEALGNRDTDMLETLKAHISGWMQDTESTNAQTDMLNAMLEACYELEG